jgi:dTMP kinase|tara:strand:- start:457 stop:1041 length:585 start_codon:yes stop_codon:yes gene_type:complete
VLIDLEGIDGCGKSTQSKFLMEKFEENNEKSIILKEPTSGKYGKKLWEMLSGKREATTEQILDLFVMDRKEHVDDKINPALKEGKIVLMDRYYYSTMAYQAAAGIDVNRIRKDNEFAPKPDIVLIFDLPADLAMKRVKGHSVADVFEKEEHLEKVRAAYLNLRDDPLVRIIDSTRTPEEIFEEVWKLVSEVRNG